MGERESVYKREAPPRSLRVFLVCFFSLVFTHTPASVVKKSKDSQCWRKEVGFTRISDYFFCLRKKMEKMQGDGELDHLERPSPLTDKERIMIQDSWAKVYENCDDAGVAILVRLFVNFPSSKQYFSQFKHIEEAEVLENSAQLRKHAHRVMNALNTLVESLENAEKVSSVLKTVGKSHALRHKVDPVYFKILSGVILEVLGEAFPQVMTPEVAAAWTKLLDSVYCGISAVYEEVGWTKLSTSSG